MAEKILFVDDERSVLDGYKRILHRDFAVDTAMGGEDGLKAIQDHGPYAVVDSDMQMPGMTGAQFLARVRQTTPDTVRMLLTGHADLNSAMEAVNEGNIFRFLTKPCDKEVLAKAVTTGLIQYRLVTAERELLENTLMGSIKVLTDVLSAAVPEAFGRSLRIARCVRHLVNKWKLPEPWRFEAAAMLSQLGCVTLDPEIVQNAYVGNELSAEERARFNAHPQVAKDLLTSIPRLEAIAWMISQQLSKEPLEKVASHPVSAPEVLQGAKILRLAVAFDNLKLKGLSEAQAMEELRHRGSGFDGPLVDSLAGIKSEGETMQLRKVLTTKLQTGMILQQEIRTRPGMLVVGKGQEVTHALLIKLENFARTGAIEQEVVVLAPA